MTRNNKNKRGRNPRPQNKQKRKSDKIVLRGEGELVAVATSLGNGAFGGSNSQQLNPPNLDDRVASISTNFSRYRIVSFNIKYIPQVGSTASGALAIGFLDDDVTIDGSLNTYAKTASLRVCLETQVWQKAAISWRPIDREKWYYVNASSSEDQRFLQQVTLIGNTLGAATSTTYGTIIYHYVIEFEGAVDSGSGA
jgi:hypothetical protein